MVRNAGPLNKLSAVLLLYRVWLPLVLFLLFQHISAMQSHLYASQSAFLFPPYFYTHAVCNIQTVCYFWLQVLLNLERASSQQSDSI